MKTTSELAGEVAALLGPGAPIDAHTLVARLSDARTRVAAVRFILGRVVVDGISPTSSPESTLLPPEIAECYQMMSSSARLREG